MVPNPVAEHIPVLVAEMIDCLRPAPNGIYIDATLGAGGHSRAILDAGGTSVRLFALDRCEETMAAASKKIRPDEGRFELVNGNFSELEALLENRLAPGGVDGILYDLGLSRFLLDAAGRGFSFRRPDETLDMRFSGREETPTAADLLRELPEKDLADLFYGFGGINRSRALARLVVRERARAPIETAGRLAGIARRVIPRRGRLDPATQVFQALRIAVNRELDCLADSLPQAVRLLKPGGRLVVISYHSLEDRIVKRFFRENPDLAAITRKPIRAGARERGENPASRSAKLRAAEKVKPTA